MFEISSLIFLLAVTTPSDDIKELEYGKILVEEEKTELPRLSLDANYALDVSNSFLEQHSATVNAQARIWRYISSGIFFHYIDASLSDAGSSFRNLEEDEFNSEIVTPHWGVFSHTQVLFFLGKWNFFNWFYLQVDLLGGGGIGYYKEKADLRRSSSGKFGYLWSVQQRMHFHENFGLNVGLLGHNGGTYFQSGLSLSWK